MTAKVLEGERITLDPMGEYEVLPPCENKTGGHWHCVKHKRGFGNAIDKDNHVKATCRMVWVCHEHGPEQP